MKYISSRNKNYALESHQAIIRGLAEDGGLFTPASYPDALRPEDILGKDYRGIAETVLKAMLADYTEEEIRHCVNSAYDTKFDTDEIVPLTALNDGWLMELWHGPTSAFKDLALTILPHLLTTAYAKEDRHDVVSILTATSGDTGKAALSGFADVPNTAITVFYPEIGVSAVQKRQMNTSKGNNVEVIAVKGNFDDCQRMVKEACSSKEVLDACTGVTISSANSINAGRLIPQIVYYFHAYAKLVSDKKIAWGDPVSFAVPTGNFGDILAGWLAKKIGLPVGKLLCASNTNNVLTDFLNTGTYSLDRTFHTTMSPSMDILISSNLERLLFLLTGQDDEKIREWMRQLKEEGSYTVDDAVFRQLQDEFAGIWTSEEECAEVIHDTWSNEHVLIDPHTAVALSAMRKYRKESGDETPCVVLSTASPYKFCHDVLECISGRNIPDDFEAMEVLHELTSVPVPANLRNLKTQPVRFTRSIEIRDGMHVIAERMRSLSHVQD